MCNRPSGMRPEAQLSAPMNWDTSLYDKNVWEDIWMCYYLLSLGYWKMKLSPDPDRTEAPETGYPELVLVWVLLRFT